VKDVSERADRQRADVEHLQAFPIETIEGEQTRLFVGAPREQDR
jgi:hypothetical protein